METSGNYRGVYEASGVTELQLISGRPACRFAGPADENGKLGRSVAVEVVSEPEICHGAGI